MHALLSDPWVAAQVDAAIAPYRGKLPNAELAWMRDQLAEVLSSDGAAAAVLRGAHPRAVETSGEVIAVGAAGDDVAPEGGTSKVG